MPYAALPLAFENILIGTLKRRAVVSFDWIDAERRFGVFWCVRLRVKLKAFSLMKACGASDWLALLPGKFFFFDAIKTAVVRD